MSLTHANQPASVSVLTVLSDIPVSQSEIADVVAFARQGQSYRFVAMIIGSEAIQKALDLGLVCCEKGVLSVPVVEAPAVQAEVEAEAITEVAPRPTWLSISERYAITNKLIEFVAAQVPSLEKLGKKEIAVLNNLMPTELKNDVTILGLTKSTRGANWGEPRNYLLIKFVYFTGKKDDRVIDLTELEQAAAKIEVIPVAEVPVEVPVEAPAVAPVIENVEPTTEQCAISDIEQQDELAKQIETCSQSNDVAYRLHAAMLAECTGQDWWSATIKEAEEEMKLTNLIEPIILDPQLKLRQATLTKQIFTGDYSAVKRNAQVLSIGGSLNVRMRRHGSKGCWLLIVEENKIFT